MSDDNYYCDGGPGPIQWSAPVRLIDSPGVMIPVGFLGCFAGFCVWGLVVQSESEVNVQAQSLVDASPFAHMTRKQMCSVRPAADQQAPVVVISKNCDPDKASLTLVVRIPHAEDRQHILIARDDVAAIPTSDNTMGNNGLKVRRPSLKNGSHLTL